MRKSKPTRRDDNPQDPALLIHRRSWCVRPKRTISNSSCSDPNLPDPDDRHVVAAAIEAKASHILTWNLRDFPAKELRKNRLIRETPDGFLAGIYDEAPDLVIESLANARRNLTKSGSSGQDFLELLGRQGFTKLARRLRSHASAL